MKKKLTLGVSPITNSIFAGSLVDDGRKWGANKCDVTIDALSSVIEHCQTHEKRNDGEKVCVTGGGFKYTITIKKEKACDKGISK